MRPVPSALLVTLGVMLGLSVRCSRPPNDGHLASLSENVHKASLVTDSVIQKVDSVTQKVTQRIARLTIQTAVLDNQLAANDSLLSTSTLIGDDSSATYTLTVALERTTEVARLYRDSTQVLVSTVLFSIAAHEAERAAWLAEREHNTILSAAQDTLISALRAANRCSVLRIPCPTRKQAAVGGFLVGVLAVVAR